MITKHINAKSALLVRWKKQDSLTEKNHFLDAIVQFYD